MSWWSYAKELLKPNSLPDSGQTLIDVTRYHSTPPKGEVIAAHVSYVVIQDVVLLKSKRVWGDIMVLEEKCAQKTNIDHAFLRCKAIRRLPFPNMVLMYGCALHKRNDYPQKCGDILFSGRYNGVVASQQQAAWEFEVLEEDRMPCVGNM